MSHHAADPFCPGGTYGAPLVGLTATLVAILLTPAFFCLLTSWE